MSQGQAVAEAFADIVREVRAAPLTMAEIAEIVGLRSDRYIIGLPANTVPRMVCGTPYSNCAMSSSCSATSTVPRA